MMLPPPCRAEAAADGNTCRRCNRVNLPGLDRCEQCRSILRGNRLALKTGLHASNSIAELRVFEREGQALFEQSLIDAGGAADLSARQVALHQYRAALHTDILKISFALRHQGLFDRRGRLREKWIQRYESLINSARGLDKDLGLRREPKAQTLAEYFDTAPRPVPPSVSLNDADRARASEESADDQAGDRVPVRTTEEDDHHG